MKARQNKNNRAETVELPETSYGQHVSMGYVNYVNGVPVSVQLNESADFVMNNKSNTLTHTAGGNTPKRGPNMPRTASHYATVDHSEGPPT